MQPRMIRRATTEMSQTKMTVLAKKTTSMKPLPRRQRIWLNKSRMLRVKKLSLRSASGCN